MIKISHTLVDSAALLAIMATSLAYRSFRIFNLHTLILAHIWLEENQWPSDLERNSTPWWSSRKALCMFSEKMPWMCWGWAESTFYTAGLFGNSLIGHSLVPPQQACHHKMNEWDSGLFEGQLIFWKIQKRPDLLTKSKASVKLVNAMWSGQHCSGNFS